MTKLLGSLKQPIRRALGLWFGIRFGHKRNTFLYFYFDFLFLNLKVNQWDLKEMCVCGQTWSSWWAKWKAKEMTDEMRITYLTTDDRNAHYHN